LKYFKDLPFLSDQETDYPMKVDQRRNDLLAKFTDGDCTPAEWKELLDLVGGIDEEDLEALTPPLMKLWEQARRDELPSRAYLIDREKMYAAITRDEGMEGKDDTTPLIPIKRWFGWRQGVAAAVIGVLLFTGIHYYISRQRTDVVRHKMILTPELVNPGSGKATLTLATGQQIILDDVIKGSIARQGAATIVNEGNGRLSYVLDKKEHPVDDLRYNTLSTVRASQYQIVLADGTRVWLNAGSSLRFPTTFSGPDRTVQMTGEAYFDVAKDASRPFHVKVNGTDIEVLGTQFNINAYTDEATLKTSLVEGAVKVSAVGQKIVLAPDEESNLTADGTLTYGPGDTELAAAWKNGYFQFDKAPLTAVMRQIGRWYDLDIKYTGPVPDRLFKGKLQRNLPLSGILRILQAQGVHFILEERVLKVTD
jgi:transmembrane sensor